MVNGKRTRKQTDRFGQTSNAANKNHYFLGGSDDDSDKSHRNDADVDAHTKRKKTNQDGQTDDDYVPESDDEANNNDTGSLKNKTEVKQIKTAVQMARIEAKMDGLIDINRKILQTVISLTTNSTNSDVFNDTHDFLSIFPIKTEESLDRFERSLSENAFRRSAVSFCFECILSDKFCYYKLFNVEKNLQRFSFFVFFPYLTWNRLCLYFLD